MPFKQTQDNVGPETPRILRLSFTMYDFNTLTFLELVRCSRSLNEPYMSESNLTFLLDVFLGLFFNVL